MKVTNVKTRLASKPFTEFVGSGHMFPPTARDLLFATIETDEGITGTGFVTGLGFVDGSEIRIVRTIVDTALRHLLMGEDPGFTERIWDKLFRGTIRFGRKGAVLRAISLVDIALWDLRGRALERPVHTLLGTHKLACPIYGSGGHYQAADEKHEKFRQEVEFLVGLGFRGIKVKVGGAPVATDVRRIAMVRETIGEDIELMVDANEGWTLQEAFRFANDADDLKLAWIEEPIANDNLWGYQRLSQSTRTPIAAGENEYTRYGFYQLLHQGGILICQPDVTRVGGVSEWVKIANLASTLGVPVVPHGVHELHIQLAAASAAVPMLEYFVPENPIQSFISECVQGVGSPGPGTNGLLEVPDGPGFGLQYDEEAIAAYETG